MIKSIDHVSRLVHTWHGAADSEFAVDISGIQGRVPGDLAAFYSLLGGMAVDLSETGKTGRPRFIQDRLVTIESLQDKLSSPDQHAPFLMENQGVWTVFCEANTQSQNIFVLENPSYTDADIKAPKRLLNVKLNQFLISLALCETLHWAAEPFDGPIITDNLRPLTKPHYYVWSEDELSYCEYPGPCQIWYDPASQRLIGRWAGMQLMADIPARVIEEGLLSP